MPPAPSDHSFQALVIWYLPQFVLADTNSQNRLEFFAGVTFILTVEIILVLSQVF